MNNGASFHNTEFPTKNGQPKEFFFSSDAHALVEHTKKVLVVEDGEVVHIKVHALLSSWSLPLFLLHEMLFSFPICSDGSSFSISSIMSNSILTVSGNHTRMVPYLSSSLTMRRQKTVLGLQDLHQCIAHCLFLTWRLSK